MHRVIVNVLCPALCWSCRAPARAGEPLCDPCDRALSWLGERRGAAPLGTPGRLGGAGDGWSPGGHGGLDQVWTPLAFDGPARDLVHGLKFRRAPGLAAAMARHVLEGAPRDLLAPPAAVVPVPGHAWRRRARGFDHAEALAHEVGRLSGRPVIAALRRAGAPGAHQRGLGRAGRLGGTGFAARARMGAVPLSAVIVDDVCTTGATLAACALALRRAGATSVSAIAYARVL